MAGKRAEGVSRRKIVGRFVPVLFVALLAFSSIPIALPISAATLSVSLKKVKIRGRIVAQAPTMPLASIGLNTDNYIFAVQSKTGREYVKLSYQFLHYEPRIPDDLFDYHMLLSFSAVRDKSCDEPVQLLGTSAGGFSLKYVAGAPELPSLDAVLPCYVVTPRDYKGAHRNSGAGPFRAQAANSADISGSGSRSRR